MLFIAVTQASWAGRHADERDERPGVNEHAGLALFRERSR